jgi:CHASE2 domain-containing sensor protein
MFMPAAAVRLPVGLLLATLTYLAIVRIALPGLLTTLRRGVFDTFAHGVSRSSPEPHAARTPTVV